jgi:hypothetical protein
MQFSPDYCSGTVVKPPFYARIAYVWAKYMKPYKTDLDFTAQILCF